MTAINDYLSELDALLRVRGAARRRLLRECRDHLEDASAQHGPKEAVRRFGAAATLAATFDAEIAARRAQHSTFASIVGVLAVAGSTLALLNAASTNSPAVVLWTVVFFAAAQTAATSALLAAFQAAAMHSGPATLADVALLCRRNGCALFFAGLTMFAAAAAVPGNTSAVVLLAGPAVAAFAGFTVLRTRSLTQRLDAAGERVTRSPLRDIGEILRSSLPDLSPVALLVPSAVAACAAAFIWDRGEDATVPSALATAGIECALVVTGFVLLGPRLGLRPGRGRA